MAFGNWDGVGDEFDFEPTQWSDTDNDGYGDNQEGVNPDDCMDDSGDSYEDRNGCRDSDGDGLGDNKELKVGADPNNPDTCLLYTSDAADE